MFLKVMSIPFGILLQANLHYLIEETRKLRLIRSFKNLPSGNAFSELLIHHHDNGDSVGMCRHAGNIVWPQIPLQVLTELQHYDSPATLTGMTDFSPVNLFHNRGIIRKVAALRTRMPVLVGNLEKEISSVSAKMVRIRMQTRIYRRQMIRVYFRYSQLPLGLRGFLLSFRSGASGHHGALLNEFANQLNVLFTSWSAVTTMSVVE